MRWAPPERTTVTSRWRLRSLSFSNLWFCCQSLAAVVKTMMRMVTTMVTPSTHSMLDVPGSALSDW